MALLSLTEAKAHLRIDNTAEDTLIQIYIDSAVDHIRKYLGRPNFQYTPSIKAAALLLVGDMFENRNGSIPENLAVTRLLHPYREGIGI